MGIFSGRKTTQKERIHRLARMRMTALLLVSVGIVAFLIGMHFPSVLSPEQGSGRGAGGTAANAQVSSKPASFCLPTDSNCIITTVSSSIAASVQSVFQPLSDSILRNPSDIVYQTPLLTNDNDAQNRAILNLNAFFVTVVEIAFTSLLVIAGYQVILGRHLLLPSSTVMEIIPRAIIVMAAVQWNVWFAKLFISFENALTLDVVHLAGLNMLTDLIAGLFQLQATNLLTFLLLLVLGVMSVMLLLQMITRLALVAVSLSLMPLGLGCFFLPQTMRWGRLWLVTLSTSVMVQFLQVVALGLGGVFITALASTSLLSLDKNVAIAFLAIGTLGLVLKIPNMLQTWALHPMMDTTGAGGGSGARGEQMYAAPENAGFAGGGGDMTTVTETGAGGMMDGAMVEDAGGTLLLMF